MCIRDSNTPTLDKFAGKSIRFNQYYVSPVCAPTRSSLMTGRYSLRTGVRDTYNGGATMATSEITIAEMLKPAGYKTGVFGKWHLGDNYPCRPKDQGFDESVIHLSGGMGQVGDITTFFRKDSSYFDPVLWHNGERQSYKGYCSDVFAGEAIRFIRENKNNPFFCYLSFNAPHTPLQVPDEYYQKYKNIDPAQGFNNDLPFPEMTEKNKEDARKVYAMVENIDDNLEKLFHTLDELEISKNTLVIFMTDNGPQQRRYVAGMRGLKSDVYRGGVRVPLLLSYPAGFDGNRDIETTTAHIDILPTLAEICKVELPQNRHLDGKNLVPLLEGKKVPWENRSLFFYWTRKYPELYNNIALQKGPFKLVGRTAYDAAMTDFELYNILNDPYEQNNLVQDNTALAAKLKTELDSIYSELIVSENLVHPQPVVIGEGKENPVFLNRNDAGGDRGIWAQEEIYGYWHVKFVQGTYNFRFKFLEPLQKGGQMLLETNGIIHQKRNADTDGDVFEMKNVKIQEMECNLIPTYLVKGKRILPFWVEVEKIE
jgi:arylsulfatase